MVIFVDRNRIKTRIRNELFRQEYDDDYEDEDMDTLYRNYEILSEFYQKYYVDLRILDMTCEPAR